MSPVRYELGFYIPEDGVLHGHRRGNLKSNRDSVPQFLGFYFLPAPFFSEKVKRGQI
jgi:hypothetical protein